MPAMAARPHVTSSAHVAAVGPTVALLRTVAVAGLMSVRCGPRMHRVILLVGHPDLERRTYLAEGLLQHPGKAMTLCPCDWILMAGPAGPIVIAVGRTEAGDASEAEDHRVRRQSRHGRRVACVSQCSQFAAEVVDLVEQLLAARCPFTL